MKYVKDVPMKDQRGYERKGIGVVSECGTFLVAAVARQGPNEYTASSSNTGTMKKTIGFNDIEIRGFKQTSKPNKEGFVEGEIGETIIKHTPSYTMQTKDAKGIEGKPFVRCIINCEFRTGSRSQKHIPFSELLGDNIQILITEAINKSTEILEKLDKEGIVTHQTNTNLARTVNAFASMAARGEERRDSQKAEKPQEEVESQTKTVDEVIPD